MIGSHSGEATEARIRGLAVGETSWDALDEVQEDSEAVFLHVPARGRLVVAMLGEAPFVYAGHFQGGRLRPCHGQNSCALCAMRIGVKVRAVFSVYDVSAKRTGVLEVGKPTAKEILAQSKTLGALRGQVFHLTKEGGVNNGAIRAQAAMMSLEDAVLPEAGDPEYVMNKMWSAPDCERVDGMRIRIPGR